QWRKDGINIADEPDHLSGATTMRLSIVNTTDADEGSYDCVISGDDRCGGLSSDAALLTLCAADFNCDDTTDSQDFLDFLAAFFALQPAADFNHDTFIDSQDFFDF